jgi:hypothetical protein
VADGAIPQSKVASLTTDLANRLLLNGTTQTVAGTVNIGTLNVTAGAIVASGIRTQTPPTGFPGVYLGMDGTAPNNCGIEIACGDTSRSSYIDFTRPGVNNAGRIIVTMNNNLMTFTANAFSFGNPVTMVSTLSVTGATTCAALSSTGFTCNGNLTTTGATTLGSTLTWGGVTYNAPTATNFGNTHPTILSIKADGVTEIGKYIDFHTSSASTSEDFLVRLTAATGVLDCNTAFARLQHAGTAYRTGTFAVGSVPQILLWNNIKDVTGSVELVPFENVLRPNFTGYYQITVCWQADGVFGSFMTVHRTQLRKNGVTVVDTYLWGGGQLTCTQRLLATDKLAVFVALPAIGDAFQSISIDQTQTFFSMVQL